MRKMKVMEWKSVDEESEDEEVDDGLGLECILIREERGS